MAEYQADLVIVGAGPAGLYAAYYAGFRGWSTVVVDALPEPGGQVTALYPEKLIFDVAGLPAIRGRELVANLLAAAAPYQPRYALGEQAVGLEVAADSVLVISAAGNLFRGSAALITAGIGAFSPRLLPAAADWAGSGLVYFVPRLAAHAGQDVVIVGGGDSAFDWALALAPIARSVTLIHRREQFRAHAGTVAAVQQLGVRLLTSAELTAIAGPDGGHQGPIVSVLVTHKLTGERSELPAQAVVAALGFVANIGPLAQWGLTLDKRRIVVDSAMRTCLPRVYAAGDITTYPGKVPLISVGFGEAAIAVNNAAPDIDPASGVFPGHSSGASA
ncbi:MAG: NAD(P)/FAD-dependent oxidoreductase [Candidatus Nanopelagicales bacterium]